MLNFWKHAWKQWVFPPNLLLSIPLHISRVLTLSLSPSLILPWPLPLWEFHNTHAKQVTCGAESDEAARLGRTFEGPG